MHVNIYVYIYMYIYILLFYNYTVLYEHVVSEDSSAQELQRAALRCAKARAWKQNQRTTERTCFLIV